MQRLPSLWSARSARGWEETHWREVPQQQQQHTQEDDDDFDIDYDILL
jgi:hypothetical protein